MDCSVLSFCRSINRLQQLGKRNEDIWVNLVISSGMLNLQFSTRWNLLSARLIKYFITSSNIIIRVANYVLGFSGSTCWVAIITRVPFVLVCQLIFGSILFFLMWIENFEKKFYMSTSWRNFSKSVIFFLFLIFIFQIQWALHCTLYTLLLNSGLNTQLLVMWLWVYNECVVYKSVAIITVAYYYETSNIINYQ